MKPLRIITIALLAICCLLALTAFTYWYKATHKTTRPAGSEKLSPSASGVFAKMQLKAVAARKFTALKKYNTRICFLVDMSISSGKNRFFIYDLKNDSIIGGGLVTHGRCNESWLAGRKYSNEVGSGCTSPGRYKIGNPYNGRFGLAYKLHGLDSTNSNAFKRYVVLHAHECVPENEVEPMPICQSDGCPTLSPGFLETVAKYIDASEKPVLLWIYD
jgi:hypothetical protein